MSLHGEVHLLEPEFLEADAAVDLRVAIGIGSPQIGDRDAVLVEDGTPAHVFEGLTDGSQVHATVRELDTPDESRVLNAALRGHAPLENAFDVDHARHPREDRLQRHPIEVRPPVYLAPLRQYGDSVVAVPNQRNARRDRRRTPVPPLHVDIHLTEAVRIRSGDSVPRRGRLDDGVDHPRSARGFNPSGSELVGLDLERELRVVAE